MRTPPPRPSPTRGEGELRRFPARGGGEFVTKSEDETRKLGGKIGKAAKAGDVVTLEGPLGSGKTTFVQGFARGAGFRGQVVSPSFALTRRYLVRGKTIHHLDLYRLAGRDLPNLGLEEYFQDPKAICIVEWPEVAGEEIPADHLRVRFEHASETSRRLSFNAAGSRSEKMLRVIG